MLSKETIERINTNAKQYLGSHNDSEVRLMYGHHYRSYIAGATAEATRYEQERKELETEIKRLKWLLRCEVTSCASNASHVIEIWQQFKKTNNL